MGVGESGVHTDQNHQEWKPIGQTKLREGIYEKTLSRREGQCVKISKPT